MRAEVEEIMSQVAVETLEKLAFLFAFPGEDDGSQPWDPMTTVRVSFSGPFSGFLAMTVSIGVIEELTANMLGLDDGEDATENQSSDALKEAMNVICGNLLPAIFGNEVIIDIGVPEVLSPDQETEKGAEIPGGLEPSAKVKLELDEGQCVLFLFLDAGIPEDVVSP